MPDQLNVLVICGSLRKGSYNAALTRALPGLAPPEMKMVTAPPFESLPLYNADLQEASGFPPPAENLAVAIRAADGVLFVTPEYNWSMPGGLKNAIDWVSRMKKQPLEQAGRDPVLLARPARWRAHAVSLAHVDDVPESLHLRNARSLCRQRGEQV
jgi:chromate reductase